MVDQATPNLPARDFEATSIFYRSLGFAEAWRDSGWMILERDGMTVEFFHHPELDPATSWFSCCFRMADVGSFFSAIVSAGVPETSVGWPRTHRPNREDWGGLVGALVDPNGTLIRLVQAP